MSLIKLIYSDDKGVAPYGKCHPLIYTSKSEPGTIHEKHEFLNEIYFK